MRILITGVCGFVGSVLAECLLERADGIRIFGIDNLMRPGGNSRTSSALKYSVRLA